MAKFDIAIIDIESYLYNACGACKVILEYKPTPTTVGVFVEALDIKKGLDYMDTIINSLLEAVGSSTPVLVLGDRDSNFRKSLLSTYKCHRGAKPLPYDMLLDNVIDKYKTVMLKNLEADDTARIIFEDDKNFEGEKIIVTIDKDFYSVPCTLYRDNPKDRVVVKVTEEDARVNELVQVIMGDKTDGYGGIPNYGEVKARKFVTKDTTLDDVIKLYEENGLTKADAMVNYSMAHIVAHNEYNFLTNKVKPVC